MVAKSHPDTRSSSPKFWTRLRARKLSFFMIESLDRAENNFTLVSDPHCCVHHSCLIIIKKRKKKKSSALLFLISNTFISLHATPWFSSPQLIYLCTVSSPRLSAHHFCSIADFAPSDYVVETRQCPALSMTLLKIVHMIADRYSLIIWLGQVTKVFAI